MRSELELAPEPNATLLRTLAAFARAREDQVPFEFSKSAKHRSPEFRPELQSKFHLLELIL
jgi:hypothetical protein